MYMVTVTYDLHEHSHFDPYHHFIDSVPFLVESARSAARIDSHSYRGFLVGAAAFTLVAQSQEIGIFTSGNLKRGPHTAKVCAEKKALARAEKAGYAEAIGIVVAATSDTELIEEVTGVASPTLHPCGECRRLFDKHPIMQDETLIVTVGLDSDEYQVHSHAQLRTLYERNETELLMQPSGYGFGSWDMHVATYEFLTHAETAVPEGERRSPAKLAQLALLATSVENIKLI